MRVSVDCDKSSSKIGDERWHNIDTVLSLLRLTWSKKLNRCKQTGINVLYRYNKTVKVWLFRDTGSIHYPSPKFISLASASGNKPGLGVMETAYIPHNHTLTVY